MFCIKFRPVSLRVTSAHFSQRFWGGCFTCGLFCTYLRPCRKPEALWEAALASRVVPEGGGPLPALSEGTRAWGGDPAQATHQAGLVFLETPVLVSACLLKGVLHWHLTFTWATAPMKTQTNPAPPCCILRWWACCLHLWINDSVLLRLDVSVFGEMYVPLFNCGWLHECTQFVWRV